MLQPSCERVQLFIGGTLPGVTAEDVGKFVHKLTGYAPTQVALESGRTGKATIEGRGVCAAAALVQGRRCDAERAFDRLGMHNEWFCPCGKSGPEPLSFVARCPACNLPRPATLHVAAAAFADHESIMRHAMDPVHILRLPLQPRPSHLPPLPLPQASAQEHTPQTNSVGRESRCTPITLQHPVAPGGAPPLALAADCLRVSSAQPPAKRVRMNCASEAACSGTQAAKARAAAGNVECVELFLGGVMAGKTKADAEAYLRRLAGVDTVRVADQGQGCFRATLKGSGALAAAASSNGKQGADSPIAEIKMHLDWYCPCTSGESPLIHRYSACVACGAHRPANLHALARRHQDRSTVQVAAPTAPMPQVAAPTAPAAPLPTPASAARPAATGIPPPGGPPFVAQPTACPPAPATALRPPLVVALPPWTAASADARSKETAQRMDPTAAWDVALGGGFVAPTRRVVLLTRERALIYDKLEACIHACADNNAAAAKSRGLVRTDTWRPWSYDLPKWTATSGASPKRYIAAPIVDFCGAYARLAPAHRHAYEMVQHTLPCWPYFDLEYERGGGLNSGFDGDAACHRIVEAAHAELTKRVEQVRARGRELARASLAPCVAEGAGHATDVARAEAEGALSDGAVELETLALESHRPDKYSRHLILKPFLCLPDGTRVPMLLADSARSAKAFACSVVGRLGTSIAVERKGEQSSVAAAAGVHATSPDVGSRDSSVSDYAALCHSFEANTEGSIVAGSGLGSAEGGGQGGGRASAFFVDLGVYTQRRAFRLVASSKLGGGSAFKISDEASHQLSRFPAGGEPARVSRSYANLPLSDQLRQTLVNPELPIPAHLRPTLSTSTLAWVTLDVAALSTARGSPTRRPLRATQDRDASATSVGAARASRERSGEATEHGGAVRAPSRRPEEDANSIQGDQADDPRAAWFSLLDGVTAWPLLDLPPSLGPPHPFIRCTRSGSNTPPPPFAALAEWAAVQFGRWGTHSTASLGGCSVRRWSYVCADWPQERLLHMTAEGTRFCFSRGRQHKSQAVMLTVDLNGGFAWQRCWDAGDCVLAVGAGQRIKSRHSIGRPPAGALPSHSEMEEFEVSSDPGRST